ncbi:hypothetical protein D3C71_1509530 [compost metagenome]
MHKHLCLNACPPPPSRSLYASCPLGHCLPLLRPAGDQRLRAARCQAARMDLPAHRAQLAGCRYLGHGGRVDRLRLAPERRVRAPACVVAARARRRCTRAALSAWRALERVGLVAAHTAHAVAGLFGAGHRLPRLWSEQRRPAVGKAGDRGRARGLGLAGAAPPAAAALHLRPFAGRRDCHCAGQRCR